MPSLCILKILNFCIDFFAYVEKQLDKKDKFNFKVYDVLNWKTLNYNAYIP